MVELKEYDPKFHSYIKHPLICIALIVPFLLATYTFLSAVSSVVFPFGLAALIAIVFSVIFQIVISLSTYKDPVAPGDRIWEPIVLCLLLAVLVFLVQRDEFFTNGYLAPKASVFAYLAFAVAGWYISVKIHNSLKTRESYLRDIDSYDHDTGEKKEDDQAQHEEIENDHTGKSKRRLEKSSTKSVEAFQAGKNVKRMIIMMGLGIMAEIFLLKFLALDTSLLILILGGLYLLIGGMALLDESIFIESKDLLSNEIVVPERIKKRRFFAGILIILFALTVTVLNSRDESMVTLDFSSVLSTPVTRAPADESSRTTYSKPLPHYKDLPPPVPVKWFDLSFLRVIFEDFGRIVLILAALVLIFGPMVQKFSFTALKEFFLSFLQFFTRNKVKKGKKETLLFENRKKSVIIEDIPLTKEKRRERKELVREMHLLFNWAKRKKVEYKLGQTVSDFIADVRRKFPAVTGELETIVGVFNKGMFALKELSQGEIKKYKETIVYVISNKRI